MKTEFLDYYRANLFHLRELSVEFSAQYPKIAQRLNLSQLDYQDPFVERLLEGTAFLAARVEKKLEDGYPLILQHMMQRVCPIFTSPLPALAAVSFERNADDNPCTKITPDLHFEIKSESISRRLTFCPMWDDMILPLKLSDCVYESSLLDELSANELKGRDYKAGFKFSFNCNLETDSYELLPDDLNLYLNLSDSAASILKQDLQCNLAGVYLKTTDQVIPLKEICVESRLYSEKKSIFSQALQVLPGLAKLFLYFNYPVLSHFISIKNLGRELKQHQIMQGELLFCFSKKHELSRLIKSDSLRCNQLALVNLFASRSDRIRIAQEPELLVEINHTEPLNYEIFSISKLELFDGNNHLKAEAAPFYSFCYNQLDREKPMMFGVTRRQRLDGLYKKRSIYTKTDVFVSLSGEDFNSATHDTSEFVAISYATNADLPLFLDTDNFFVSEDGTLRGTLFSPLSKPQPPKAMRGDQETMVMFSFMMMNITAFLRQDDKVALNILRNLIRVFAPGSNEERESLALAINSISTVSKVFRFVKQGAVYYEPGFETSLSLNGKQLTGMGIYTFGEAIYWLLHDFKGINQDLDFVLSEMERGVIRAWKSDAR